MCALPFSNFVPVLTVICLEDAAPVIVVAAVTVITYVVPLVKFLKFMWFSLVYI